MSGIRPVGDGSHDWCFDCFVCGTTVRGDGTRFPSNTTPVSVLIKDGSIPTVDRKLTCSTACGAAPKVQEWKQEREARPDAQQAAADAAARRASESKERFSHF